MDAFADLPALPDRHSFVGEDFLLHPLLQGIRELITLAVKYLDTVVLKGVMAGGDNYAGICLHLDGQIGHSGGGDGSQGHDVAPH